MKIKLTALHDLMGSYGVALQGEPFEVESEEDAESLEARGLAERYREPKRPAHIEDFKMKMPLENKMVDPQRNKRRA